MSPTFLTLEDLYALYAPSASRLPQNMTVKNLHALFASKTKADTMKMAMTLEDFVAFIDTRCSSAATLTVADEPSSSEDEEVILTPKMSAAVPVLELVDALSLVVPDKHDWRVRPGLYRDDDDVHHLPEPSALKPEIVRRLKASSASLLPAAHLQKQAKALVVAVEAQEEATEVPATGHDLLASLVETLPPLSPPTPTTTTTALLSSSDSDTDAGPIRLRMRMPIIVHPRIPSPQRPSKAIAKPYSLTRIAIARLLQSLPKAFPKQAKALSKLSLDDLTGDWDQEVVWSDGVGRIKDFEHDEYCRGPVTQVFVDHSNILFAHLNHLESHSKGYLPTKHQRTLSLPALSLLLQRGRLSPEGSLHLVGSSPLRDRPDLDRLIRLGWECSVLKRVSSGSDAKRFREQGVDELLQLKMLQALNAYPPPAFDGATIVLATGDAQSGQFNREGFVGVVREALRRGWNVELWSFKKGLSRTWKETAKAEGWTRFSIRLLDDFAEDLVEIGDGVMTDE